MLYAETCAGWIYRGRVLEASIGAEMVSLQVFTLRAVHR